MVDAAHAKRPLTVAHTELRTGIEGHFGVVLLVRNGVDRITSAQIEEGAELAVERIVDTGEQHRGDGHDLGAVVALHGGTHAHVEQTADARADGERKFGIHLAHELAVLLQSVANAHFGGAGEAEFVRLVLFGGRGGLFVLVDQDAFHLIPLVSEDLSVDIAELDGGIDAALEHGALHFLSVFEHNHVACGLNGLLVGTTLHALHVDGAIVVDGAVGHFDLHAVVVRFEHLALDGAAALEHHVVGIVLSGGCGGLNFGGCRLFLLRGLGRGREGRHDSFGGLDGSGAFALGCTAHGGDSRFATLHTCHLFGPIHTHSGIGQEHFDGLSGHVGDDTALGTHAVAQDDEIGQVTIGDNAAHRAAIGAPVGGLRRKSGKAQTDGQREKVDTFHIGCDGEVFTLLFRSATDRRTAKLALFSTKIKRIAEISHFAA